VLSPGPLPREYEYDYKQNITMINDTPVIVLYVGSPP
jgi:hypothetical protein